MAFAEEDKGRRQADLRASGFKLGWYRHYKGGKYLAFATSVREDTGEILVHYFSHSRRTRWTRTMLDFCATLTFKGDDEVVTTKRRFLYEGEAQAVEVADAVGL